MQLRCQQCHKPFALSKDAVHAALDTMEENNYHHFDVSCPHCKRANRISRQELLRAAPEWGKKTADEQTKAK